MKIILIKILNAVFILSLLLCLQGCFVATSSVGKIGMREAYIQVLDEKYQRPQNEPMYAENGDVAIKVKIEHRTLETHRFEKTKGKITKTTETYIIIPEKVMKESISSAAKPGQSEGQKREGITYPDNALVVAPVVSPIVSDEYAYTISDPFYDLSNKDIPQINRFKQYNNGDPLKIIYKYDEGLYYKYPANSEEYYWIKYSLYKEKDGWKKRQWWGYPVQILLVPAIAFDLITFPIQFIIFWQIVGDDFP